jgi:hypothetical protein
MLSEDEILALRQRVTNMHEGEFTDEEFYEGCQNIVEEYSNSFPEDGKIYSLIVITDFMFMFMESIGVGSPYNKSSLTDFGRQLMIEASVKGDWWRAEKVAYRLMKYFALNTTYGEGGEVIYSHFNSWANVMGELIEGDHIPAEDKNKFINFIFAKLWNMHDHDVLFYPGLRLWNGLSVELGPFDFSDSHLQKTMKYLDLVEESRADFPLKIADKFRRLKMFFCLVDSEPINSRLDEGIFKYSNM